MKETEGEGWNNDQCAEVAEEYRRYLTLRLLYPNEAIVPNKAIDTMWHYHILDTAAYERDCKAIFGKLLHHYPYFGIGGGDAEQKEFIDTFAKTKALYEQTFGESMDRQDYFAAF